MKRIITRVALAFIAIAWSYAVAPASAQDRYYSRGQIERDMAPIALYPDQLLSQILMASTYPLEVQDADGWLRSGRNARLRGDQLANALDDEDWAPSVKALVPFPQVVRMMTSRPDWMDRIGEEFLAQEDDVMDAIQRLRAQASAAGNLRSDNRILVRNDGPTIIIEPAAPDVVYVPYYDPRYVYGTWEYADYPPVYFPPPAGISVGINFGGIGFYAGAPIVRPLWGWDRWDWGQRRIVVDRDRYIVLNRHREPRFAGEFWEHDAYHRRGADYRAPTIRQRFEQGVFGQRDNNDNNRDRRYENARRQWDQRARIAEQRETQRLQQDRRELQRAQSRFQDQQRAAQQRDERQQRFQQQRDDQRQRADQQREDRQQRAQQQRDEQRQRAEQQRDERRQGFQQQRDEQRQRAEQQRNEQRQRAEQQRNDQQQQRAEQQREFQQRQQERAAQRGQEQQQRAEQQRQQAQQRSQELRDRQRAEAVQRDQQRQERLQQQRERQQQGAVERQQQQRQQFEARQQQQQQQRQQSEARQQQQREQFRQQQAQQPRPQQQEQRQQQREERRQERRDQRD